jgi:Tol biopolymer transport system component
VQSNGPTTQPAISADARHVAFVSEATNLVPTDTDPEADVLIRNLITDTNQQVSFRTDNLAGSFASEPDVSGDGRFVAFVSSSPLVPGEPEGIVDVYVRDVVAGTTTLISVATDGTPANLPSSDPAISDAGGRVAFQSAATNLVAGDNNNFDDIFVRR